MTDARVNRVPESWSRAVQVNFQPPRPINRYERELLQRTMEDAARTLMRKWGARDD